MSGKTSQPTPVACSSDRVTLSNQADEETLERATASKIAESVEADIFARFDPQLGEWSQIRLRMYYGRPRSPAPATSRKG